jgi:hypothetical protein
MAPVLSMKGAVLIRVSGDVGLLMTIVPGTMLIESAAARSW